MSFQSYLQIPFQIITRHIDQARFSSNLMHCTRVVWSLEKPYATQSTNSELKCRSLLNRNLHEWCVTDDLQIFLYHRVFSLVNSRVIK